MLLFAKKIFKSIFGLYLEFKSGYGVVVDCEMSNKYKTKYYCWINTKKIAIKKLFTILQLYFVREVNARAY